MAYIKFLLIPGQQPPIGSSGVALSNGWIVYEGNQPLICPLTGQTIDSQVMSNEEIVEYQTPKPPPTLPK